jgi:hypothetical protein
MRMIPWTLWMLPTLVLLAMLGCSSEPDERLARFAEQSVATQKQQNEMLARQSEAVIRENQRVTEAAQALVEQDATARQEMVAAQRQLSEQFHAERSVIDRERAGLEQERREIATQRQRDPVVAEAVHIVGMLLLCLTPLALAAYALCRLDRGRGDGEELGELLIAELASDTPRLLPSPLLRPAGLEQGRAADANASPPASHDNDDESDPPF